MKARTTITYHGRSGKPVLHWNAGGRAYIMVRKKGGGTKRLYLSSKAASKAITKGLSKLKVEARRRKK